MTFNTFWNRFISMPASSEGSITFEHKNASEDPVSNALVRSDTVSSFNSTWDGHIISPSVEERNDRSFSEYSEELVNSYGECGLGASLDIDHGSQMSDGEGLDSDNDAATVCGDYSEFHAECINDVNMDSEASVSVPIAFRLPSSPPPPRLNACASPSASNQYMGPMTRSRKIKMEPAARNKDSQQESTAYSIIWEGKRKHYSCNTCLQSDTRKDRMMAHVRQNHAS